MIRRSLIVLLLVWAVSVHGQEVVESFFTAEGGNAPISLNGGQKCGQRFTATVPFEGIEINGPTWGVSGEKGMTIRLYVWQGSYEATVGETPIVTSVLTDLEDNAWFPAYAGAELPAGEYFWEASEPTNSNPEAENPHQIGCWLWNESRYEDGEAYFNGEPYSTVSMTWMSWYGDGQGGTWTPFPFPETDVSALAQSFTVPWTFQGVGMTSPTWHGSGCGYRMRLYEWDTDYATTIQQTPIAEKTVENHSDNARAEMTLDAPQPSGKYLLLTDLPVRPEGDIGHWGWTDSDWWDQDNVAYADGVALEPFVSFALYLGELTSEPIGKDFASRSLIGVATKIGDWNLY